MAIKKVSTLPGNKLISADFDSKKEENEKNFDGVQTVTLTNRKGEVTTFEVEDGFIMISDSKAGHMISIIQGDLQYLSHGVNVLITLITKSLLPPMEDDERGIEQLYNQMQPITTNALESINKYVRIMGHMLGIVPKPVKKGEGN